MTEAVAAAEWRERAAALASDGWWLADLCGLDRFSLGGDGRFEVVVQLLHRGRKERLTLHVSVLGDPPVVASVVDVWPGANFFEREAYDMYGIEFEGHPNLTRILMPDEWEGHPLRKDYGVGKVPIEFAPQPFLQIDPPGQSPKGAEAGQIVDRLGQPGEPRRDLGGAPGSGSRGGKQL